MAGRYKRGSKSSFLCRQTVAIYEDLIYMALFVCVDTSQPDSTVNLRLDTGEWPPALWRCDERDETELSFFECVAYVFNGVPENMGASFFQNVFMNSNRMKPLYTWLSLCVWLPTVNLRLERVAWPPPFVAGR